MSGAHYFGIRHHGSGSARRLIEALDALQPVSVLIEGPADVSHLLPFLNDPAMVAPVALLTYAEDDPGRANFWPFAVFSLEYQAARWALSRGATVRFIDLPASWRLARAGPEDSDIESAADNAPPDNPIQRDPIGALAEAAGYEDGESWWRDLIEENPSGSPVFRAIADAMSALRSEAGPISDFEAAREAHMRLEIAEELKSAAGPVAIVCGAWHVPALEEKRAPKDDKALLKKPPRQKIAATWAPWTSPRLAYASGYGAGVAAPGWSKHLWETPHGEALVQWLTKIAIVLRAEGHFVSTASVIEACRLAKSLAAMRVRAQPGFEEAREAVIACFCHGERLLWATISAKLLIGSEVGAIPDGVPLAPLLEDLKRQQTATRMKPEALERPLALDLRSESGLARSTLLHRLCILGVGWGRLDGAGKSRGTFRENWTIAWQPEFAVQLVECLVYGATIEQASGGKLEAHLREAKSLPQLASLTRDALTAQLGEAASRGIDSLERRAAQTSDCGELLATLPPISDVLRYGEARATGAELLGTLFERIAISGALALPYAGRNLDAEASRALAAHIRFADAAIRLNEPPENVMQAWTSALETLTQDPQSDALCAGLSARLLYENDLISAETVELLLSRSLSPGTAIPHAAGFFEGFFEGGGERLIHDETLRKAVDTWMLTLDEDNFIEHLPLFRRVFSSLDKMERRRLFEAVTGRGQTGGLTGLRLAQDADAIWARHFERITGILNAGGGS